MNQVTPRRRATRVFASIAASAALVLGTVGLTAPAQALGESTATFSPSVGSGFVGVPVVINVTLADTLAPGNITVIPQGTNSGPAAAITIPNVTGSTTSFKFIPPHVGFWTFQAQGFTTSTTTTSFSAQAVPVTVTVSAPNTVQVGTAVTVTATVSAQNGSLLAPTGQIQFATVGGGNIGGPIFLNAQKPSTASFQWTPATVGQVQFIATYLPSTINGFPDTSCANNCVSQPDTVQVTTTGVNVFLSNPPQYYVGTPGTITATVSAKPSNGSANFTVNGQVIASNVAVGQNGIVSTTWTPSAAGNFTVAVAWTGNSGVTGTASEVVNVTTAAPSQDRIVLTQAGGGAWANGGTYPVANGSQISFAATTASGSGVTLTAAGPCTVSGLSVTANQGSGSCILTASSPGGNTYSPGTSSYTIQLVPGRQVPRVNPRPSGRIPVGNRVTLEGPGNNDTNAGQNMNWRVTSGRAVCKLIYPSNGAVRLQMVKRGSCNVRATAPAVPGQWNRLVLNRSYRSN
jgi:hypothetical protein